MIHNSTKALAQHKWFSILSNFINPQYLSGKHCPCPICGGKDRFRWDNLDGNGSYFCSCGAGTGIHLLAQTQGITHSDAWRLVETVIGTSTEEKPKPLVDRAARINRVLKACMGIRRGGDVHRYLYSRGLTPDYTRMLLSEAESTNGDSMMVGRFSMGSKLAGLHITFLKDGKKIEGEDVKAKKMFAFEKDGLLGSAIRLYPLNGGSRLIVAEGIETALSVAQKMGLPAWATGSAHLMENVEIPEQVTEVIIAGDNDFSYTGQAAAFALAKRLVHAKKPKSVTVIFPDEMGTDFNDILLDKTHGM